MKRVLYGTRTFYNAEGGKINIKDGTVYLIQNYSSEEILVEGGTVRGSTGINNYSENANVTITGGTVNEISNYNKTCKMNLIVDGENAVVARGTDNRPNGIYVTGTFNINFKRGKIEYVYLSLGNIDFTMEGGTLGTIYLGSSSNSTAGNINIKNGEVTGSVTTGSDINLTLGENDGIIHEDFPILKNGLTTNGIFNFYDGTIIASSTTSTSITGSINELATNAELQIEQESNKEKVTLTGFLGPIAKIDRDVPVEGEENSVEYNTLQDAVNAYNGEKSGIVLLRNFSTYENVTIPEKDVTINLNGMKAVAFSQNYITNNGNLVIKDLLSTGEMEIKNNELIVNNGTLDMQSGIYTISKNGITTSNSNYKGYNRVITNNGILNINGATIRNTVSCITIIYNEKDSVIKMNNGIIGDTKEYSYSCGIYNFGELNQFGGKIINTSRGIDNEKGGNVVLKNATIQLSGSDSSKARYI